MKATQFDSRRVAFHKKMALAYHGFLTYVFLQNEGDTDLHRGLAETRNKFLSSYYIESEETPAPTWLTNEVVNRYKGSSRRYLRGDYYSEAVLRTIGSSKSTSNELRFEHVVPKGEGIKEACEAAFKRGAPMAAEEIARLLDARWHIAVVTKAEDDMLRTSRKMPIDADADIFVRYCDDNGRMLFPLLRSNEDSERCKELLLASRF